MIQIIGNYLRADRYGIYLWTSRFCASAMWPLRFWEVGRTTYLPHSGNYHFGSFYIAWYGRATWEAKPA